MSIATEKKAHVRSTLATQYTSTDLEQYARSASVLIQSNALWRTATQVLAYTPLKDEIPFLDILLKQFPEKQWFIPYVHDIHMDFMRIEKSGTLTNQLWHGSIHTPAICIVPARALDARGNRLGRGKGFYDRFLGMHDMYITTVSVVPDFAFLDSVPTESHDKAIDFVYKACPNT